MKFLLIFFILISTNVIAEQDAQSLAKIGNSCPQGYSLSGGNYCIPNNNAKFAISKVSNSCPQGYSVSGGNYCLATGSNTKFAMEKHGNSCPSGYSVSGGDYCLSNK
jgi:hypothetical protein